MNDTALLVVVFPLLAFAWLVLRDKSARQRRGS